MGGYGSGRTLWAQPTKKLDDLACIGAKVFREAGRLEDQPGVCGAQSVRPLP